MQSLSTQFNQELAFRIFQIEAAMSDSYNMGVAVWQMRDNALRKNISARIVQSWWRRWWFKREVRAAKAIAETRIAFLQQSLASSEVSVNSLTTSLKSLQELHHVTEGEKEVFRVQLMAEQELRHLSEVFE